MWDDDPRTLIDRLPCIWQMGCSNSISPHKNKDIGFFLKEYKEINKAKKLGDLYLWVLMLDGSTQFLFPPITFKKRKYL